MLSLRVGTTGGNRLREIQQELIQAQMADAGIEIPFPYRTLTFKESLRTKVLDWRRDNKQQKS